MVANQAYTMIRAILSVSILVHDTPENTGSLSCLGPFQMTGSLPVPQVVASPWFPPSRPKAEVSSFCTGSLPWETLPLIYLRFLLLPFIFAFPADGLLAAVFVSERVSISFSTPHEMPSQLRMKIESVRQPQDLLNWRQQA